MYQNILFLDKNNILLFKNTNDKLNCIFFSEPQTYDYNVLRDKIKNLKTLNIVIDSITEYSEYKAFNVELKKNIIENSINNLILKEEDKLYYNISLLYDNNANIHINDRIVTTISKNESEKHIDEIIKLILLTNTTINGMFSYSQFCNNILKFDLNTINYLNIVLIIEKISIRVVTFNGSHFIFGRKIIPRNNESVALTINKNLSIIIKYLNTSLSFISLPININIFSTVEGLTKEEIIADDIILRDINFIFYSDFLDTQKEIDSIPEHLRFTSQIIDFISKNQIVNKYKNVLKLKNQLIDRKNFINIAKKALFFSIIGLIVIFILLLSDKIYNLYKNTLDYNKLNNQYKILNRKIEDINNVIELKSNKENFIINKIHKYIDIEQNIKKENKILTILSNIINSVQDAVVVTEYNYKCINCNDTKNKYYNITMNIVIYNSTGLYDDFIKLYDDIKDKFKVINGKYPKALITFDDLPNTQSLYFNQNVKIYIDIME